MRMKLEIVTEKDNPLRKRKRYWLGAEHPGKETPSRHELLPEVVRKLGTKEELVVIDKIFSERGSAKSAIKVLVYKDKQDILPAMLARQQRKVKAFLEKKEKMKGEQAETPQEEEAAEKGKGDEEPETGSGSQAEPAEEKDEEGGGEEEPVKEDGSKKEE
ncbi:MAG: hypothetical protein JXC85_01415 [Candidatus Aenigmarchaeota archaeon]|nr:hypothetical protein [Candidatus Aenigmarchaeota archaeon]